LSKFPILATLLVNEPIPNDKKKNNPGMVASAKKRKMPIKSQKRPANTLVAAGAPLRSRLSLTMVDPPCCKLPLDVKMPISKDIFACLELLCKREKEN